jgi:hypothetical protein
MRKTVSEQIWDVLNRNKLQPEEAVVATFIAIREYIDDDECFEKCLLQLMQWLDTLEDDTHE